MSPMTPRHSKRWKALATPSEGGPLGPAPWLAVLVLLGAGGCGGSEPSRVSRVLLLTCDTLRADRLGVYGYDEPTSPALDAFAADALVFDQAYASAPLTGPSVSSLLSGRFPDELDVLGGNRVMMPSEIDTLAERLSAAGLRTGAVVSNWVLRRVESEGAAIGFAQGFDDYDDRMPAKEQNRDKYERLAPQTTDDAIAWLEARDAEGVEDFFLWVHYQDPHGPYTPPAEWEERFPAGATGEPPLALGHNQKGRGQLPNYQALGDRRDPEFYRARYDAEIRFFDEALGRLLAWLEERGWLEDSLVVFTADHGESMGEHDYWFSHGEHLFRDVVRVPLIVRAPGVAPGRRSEPASLVDVYPTALEALGLAGSDLPGHSLLRARSGGAAFHSLGPKGSDRRWDGWVEDGYHLVVEPGGGARLFDLAADPLESTDLAGAEPERASEMRRKVEALKQRLVPAAEGIRREMSGEDLEAFGHLGYTDGGEPGAEQESER